MPSDATYGDLALVAKFDHKDAAHIACSMLRDAGISFEEETKYRVFAVNLSPEERERARIILENAGASAVADGGKEITSSPMQPNPLETPSGSVPQPAEFAAEEKSDGRFAKR